MIELFLGISPHKPELDQLHKDMKKYCSILNSIEPLIFPPHITLVRRFQAMSISELTEKLIFKLEKVKSFKVTLDKMGYFEKPPILFYYPSNSIEINLLHNLSMDLCDQNGYEFSNKFGNPYVREFFQPHITLAGPDVDTLKMSNFLKKTLPEVNISFDVRNICIYMQKGGKWIIERRITLGE